MRFKAFFLASPWGVQPAMNDTPGACQNRRVTEPQRELSAKLTDEGKTKGQQNLGFCLIRHGFAVPPSPRGKASF